jgi:transposase
LSLLRLGWSVRRVARETGRRHETIRRYGQRAGVLASRPRSKPHTLPEVPTDSTGFNAIAAAEEDPKPHTRTEVPTDSQPAASECESAHTQQHAPSESAPCEMPVELAAALRSPIEVVTRSSCEPHRAFITLELGKGRNGVAIYQDMVEHHGYEGSYDAVKRFARTLRDHEPEAFCRFESEPGEEAQVDYGEGAPTRHPRTGRLSKPDLFVFTLGYSRYGYQETVWDQSAQTWCELHERAFAYIGGTTKMIRQDNLKAAVIKPDIYDPQLNELYASALSHYGTIAVPCRPYAPNLKGKVESSVGYVQRTALKGREFASIEEQNAFLLHHNERWGATRIHGTTKRQVREMFDEERPFLLPLPLGRFEYYRILERRVHPDGHIEVARAYYSAPLRYVGRTVVVHVGRLWLRILDPASRLCVREHEVTRPGGRRTVSADLPRQTPRRVDQIVARIDQMGTNCGAFARAVVAERGIVGLRTLYGMLDLAKRHDVAQIDQACALAVAGGFCKLRLLRAFLAHRQPLPPLRDQHPIIPLIDKYADHFATLTRGDTPHDP